MGDNSASEIKPKLWVYPPKGRVEKLKLTPLTKLTWHISNQLFRKNKNLVLVYPSNTLKLLPLFSYEFMKREKRDVMVFTKDKGRVDENPYENHKRNYSLLADENREYVFYNYIPGSIQEGKQTVDVRVADALHLPRANRKAKEELKSHLKKLSQQKKKFEKQLLLFQKNKLRHRNVQLANRLTYKDTEYSDIPLDIGLIIFENLSSKFWGQRKIEEFAEWLEPCIEENIQLFFHLSDYIDLEYINILKEKTNSIVLYLPKDLLAKDRNFFYHDGSEKILSHDTLKKYNLDSEEIYHHSKSSISKRTMRGEGIKTAKCWSLLEEISLREENEKSIKNILWHLPRLFIRPSSYRIHYRFKDGSHRNIRINTFLNFFDEETQSEGSPKKRELLYALRKLYDKLDKTKRYGEKLSYPRKSKPYELTFFLEKKRDKWEDGEKKFLVGTFDGLVRNKLEEKLRRNLGTTRFGEVRTLQNLSHEKETGQEDTVLVLPSPLPTRYFSLLLRGYEKIVMFCYGGREEERFEEQSELIESVSDKFLRRAVESFDNIYDYFGWDKENVPEGLNSLKEDPGLGIVKGLEGETVEAQVKETIKQGELDGLEKQEKEFKELESSEFSLGKKDEEELVFCISRFPGGKPKRDIHLSSSDSLINIEEGENRFKQKNAREINEGDLIMLIDKKGRKTLVELLAEEMGLEKDLDTTHLTRWKEKLREYISIREISVKEFYRRLSKETDKTYQAVLSWVRGKVIGPRNPEDLRRIGEMIDYPYLIEEYENLYSDMKKLRNIHRKLGRKIEKIVQNKLEEGRKDHDLPFDEFALSRRLTVYQVEKIAPTD